MVEVSCELLELQLVWATLGLSEMSGCWVLLVVLGVPLAEAGSCTLVYIPRTPGELFSSGRSQICGHTTEI